MSVTLPDCANQEAKVCLMVCRVTAYRLSPSSGARLSFLTESGNRRVFSNAVFARLLEDGFRRLARIRLEHPDHILRHADEYPLSSLLNDIEAAGIAVHILPAV